METIQDTTKCVICGKEIEVNNSHSAEYLTMGRCCEDCNTIIKNTSRLIEVLTPLIQEKIKRIQDNETDVELLNFPTLKFNSEILKNKPLEKIYQIVFYKKNDEIVPVIFGDEEEKLGQLNMSDTILYMIYRIFLLKKP